MTESSDSFIIVDCSNKLRDEIPAFLHFQPQGSVSVGNFQQLFTYISDRDERRTFSLASGFLRNGETHMLVRIACVF